MRPIYDDGQAALYAGDSLAVLRTLQSESVHVCVTSPPYYALRSYSPDLVRLRSDLSDEERVFVETELARLGILPIPGVV